MSITVTHFCRGDGFHILSNDLKAKGFSGSPGFFDFNFGSEMDGHLRWW